MLLVFDRDVGFIQWFADKAVKFSPEVKFTHAQQKPPSAPKVSVEQMWSKTLLSSATFVSRSELNWGRIPHLRVT